MLLSFLFAIAVSIDAFAVGLAYGIKAIEIKQDKIWAVAFCSGLMFALAMLFAQKVSLFFRKEILDFVGAVLLILLGSYFLWQYAGDKKKNLRANSHYFDSYFGMITEMLQESNYADLDRSGEISLKEATYLGVMLALDAFCVGISAAWFGLAVWLTVAFVIASAGGFLILGLRFGKQGKDCNILGIIPGILLIGMGFMKILVGL